MRALNEGDKEDVPNGESNNSSAVGTSIARSTMLKDVEKRQRNTALDYDEVRFHSLLFACSYLYLQLPH